MKTFVRHAVTSLIIAVVCQTGSVLAQDFLGVSTDSSLASMADDQEAAPLAPAPSSLAESYVSPTPDARTFAVHSGLARRCNWAWYIDYRVGPMLNSHTSYEFGTAPGDPAGPYAPLSKLDFELDSTWHGLQVGLEKPNCRIHFEWMTPIQRNIDGTMADFDWNINQPRNDPSRLDSFTLSDERWNDGQRLDFGGEFKWKRCLFGLPIEVWPAGGFRFQRFDITASGIFQVVPPTGLDPALVGVDVITFNQQYYQAYFGGQFRTQLRCYGVPIDVRFQADGGPTWGYNIDHHLLRDDFVTGVFDRYTMETTSGGMWHIALTAEAPLTNCIDLGIQADHMSIRTTGVHRYVQASGGIDQSWTNGVAVKSDQTTLTVYLRTRF